jgi:putative transposase
MGISGSSRHYSPCADRNASLKTRLHEVVRPGLGYRGAWMALRAEFAPLNPKRVHRLWKELRLNVRPKARKRRKGTPMPDAPKRPNELWSLDFVHDACLNGTKLKILVVMDEFTRECLALEAHTSIKA